MWFKCSQKCILNNVFGPLMDTFEEQWDSFVSKVRNNYRKAEKENLTIKFYEGKAIEPHHLTSFYDIYVSTMKRNGASKMLYFSLEHFENMILNNNARKRDIVLHKADYVSYKYISENGRLGRSLGCPVIPEDIYKDVINIF